MKIEPYFKAVGEHAVFRPCGHVTLARAAQVVQQSIELAKIQRVRQLLAVITGLDGFPSPSLTQRCRIVEDWAVVAEGRMKFALVIQPWLMHPEKFGVTVARDRGFNADVFSSEQEALAWLLRAEGGEMARGNR